MSAEEAMKLFQAFDASSAEMEIVETDPGSKSRTSKVDEFEQIARKVRRLWQISLWMGVSLIVLCLYWLYTLVSGLSYGFWFSCAILLFLSGLLLLALFSDSRNSHWLYLEVDQHHDKWPSKIVLGFPLPLGLAGWILHNFSISIDGLDKHALG